MDRADLPRREVVEGLVSTVVPVRNRPDLLRESVGSVLGQTYRPIEVIVVDDGSTDETPAAARALEAAHPEVRVIRLPGVGAASAREEGRRAARGEFIQYLDSDDLLAPRKFEVQVAALRRNPEAGIAYGITRLVDAGGAVIADPFKWTGRRLETLFPALLVDRWWSTHTPLYRREVTDRIGPWSDLPTGEDWEYEARAGALRVRLVHCPVHVCDTRRHEGDRVTERGDAAWRLDAVVRLIEALHAAAVTAGVPHDAPEMRHFSRWAFLVARQAGAAGLAGGARRAYRIARRAAGPGGAPLDLRLYRAAAALLGWRGAGRAAALRDRLLRRSPGPATLPLSWPLPADGPRPAGPAASSPAHDTVAYRAG